MKGYSTLGITNTLLGDRVESAIAVLPGWKALVGKSATGYRQGAFDLEAPDGTWVEVKACAWDTEHKVKSKAREIVAKVRHAEDHGRATGTIIAVVDANFEVKVWFRPGLGNFRLSADGRGWELIAKVTI